MDERYFPPQSSLGLALRGKCPRCGHGKLYKSYLKLADKCDYCGLDLAKMDSGDGPAVFIILIAGFLIVGGALFVEVSYQPPYWVHGVLWGTLGILIPLLLRQPFKTWLIAQQYKHKAQEGRLDR